MPEPTIAYTPSVSTTVKLQRVYRVPGDVPLVMTPRNDATARRFTLRLNDHYARLRSRRRL